MVKKDFELEEFLSKEEIDLISDEILSYMKNCVICIFDALVNNIIVINCEKCDKTIDLIKLIVAILNEKQQYKNT